MERLMIFLNNCLQETILLRCGLISLAISLALTPPRRTAKELRSFAGRFAILYIMQFSAWALVDSITPVFSLQFILESVRVTVAAFIYAKIFCRYPSRIRTVMTGSVSAAVCAVIGLSYTFGTLIDMNVQGFTLPVLFAVYALAIGFAAAMVRFSMNRFQELPQGGYILIVVFNVFSILLILFWKYLEFSTNSTGYGMSAFVHAVLYLFVLLIYFSVYMMCAEREQALRARAEGEMYKATAVQIDLVRNNMKELRRIRHDMKNQFAYLSALMDGGEYDRVRKMLSAFSTQQLKPEYLVDCGNTEVSTILSMNACKADARGQKLETVLMVPPTLPFDDVDLCSVISNLIDNALDANEKYNTHDPILVQMKLREEYLYLCVANRLSENVQPAEVLRLITDKPNAAEHGLGTGIVNKLAEKYNGYASYDVDDYTFVAEVMLDMKYKEVHAQ